MSWRSKTIKSIGIVHAVCVSEQSTSQQRRHTIACIQWPWHKCGCTGDNDIFNNTDRVLVRLFTSSIRQCRSFGRKHLRAFDCDLCASSFPFVTIFVFVYRFWHSSRKPLLQSCFEHDSIQQSKQHCAVVLLGKWLGEPGVLWTEAVRSKILMYIQSNHIASTMNVRFSFSNLIFSTLPLFLCSESVCHRFSQ